MQVSQGCCPNCSRKFCFPVEYAAEQFSTICPHCHVGYNAVKVKVDEEFLGRLLFSRSRLPWWQKSQNSTDLFKYLRCVAKEFRFVVPTHANAMIFQVAIARSPYPLAVYFHNTYYQIRSFNRQVLSALLTLPVALILVSIGFFPLSVLIGWVLGIVGFSRFVTLPKIKGATLNRLVAEQALLKQSYELQQSLNRVLEVRLTYQNLLERQRTVVEQMSQTPISYQTGIDLYQRAMKCTDDYLALCKRTISQYQSAIDAIAIQIETSKLAVELPARFIDPQLEFGLGSLEDQLASSIPPEFPLYDSNNNHNQPTT